MQTSKVSVVLVDDHEMVLEALSVQIRQQPDMELAGVALDSDRAIELCQERPPDVLVIDVHLPGRGTFEVLQALQEQNRATKTLLVSGFVADVFIAQALRFGAGGYLMKTESMATLVDAIQRVARGEKVFSPTIAARIQFDAERNQYVTRFQSDLGVLTGRQIEVLRHLARGQSVKEISRIMHLSQKSVDSHKYRIMSKLGIHDRVELARLAIREGLMIP
jgi:DNA-binding NarL/FixJ family response regulator